ncbi:MAG: M20 family metallopeptidase [Betaproteobacteria bacterium]|nr:M20 family metallopeptidase [Betaproteobacteria bacterium]
MIDATQLTRDIVAINTINPPGKEDDCARHLGALLGTAGYALDYHRIGEGRSNLVARIGNGRGAPLCFTGHIDTVPLGAAPWKNDPFAGETASGKLYGRGTSDMKAGVAAFVAAAVQLAPHLRETPGLVLIITAAEETGCEGAFKLVKERDLGRAGAIVVAEPTSNYPFVGHKGAFWLRARAHGVTAHGSMPERGVNAVYKAARAVTALEAFRFSTPPHDLMGQSTLNVGSFHGGLNINSVPDEALVAIDIRTVPGTSHAQLLQQLARQVGGEVELEVMMDLESIYTPPEQEWMQSVFDVMQPVLGERPVARAATYFTDAAALTPALSSPPTVILGPGEPQMAHQTDEYCVMERIGQAAHAFERIIQQWCKV